MNLHARFTISQHFHVFRDSTAVKHVLSQPSANVVLFCQPLAQKNEECQRQTYRRHTSQEFTHSVHNFPAFSCFSRRHCYETRAFANILECGFVLPTPCARGRFIVCVWFFPRAHALESYLHCGTAHRAIRASIHWRRRSSTNAPVNSF